MVGYPKNIPELNALRFVAALWIVLFHLGTYIDLNSALIRHGPRAVDAFFILSGFIMAHVYLPSVRDKSFKYSSFLLNRFARLYPIHVTVMLLFGLAVVGAGALGIEVKQEFPPEDIAPNLLMIHAWGVTDGLSWNLPSWSISAEWFAYLVFPLVAFLLLKSERTLAKAVLLLFAGLLVIYIVLGTIDGSSMFQHTYDFAIVRILPEFIGGGMLYLIGSKLRLPRAVAMTGLLASTVAVFVLAHYDAQPGWIVLASIGAMMMLAELSKTGKSWLASRPVFYAGELSYSIYMVHILVFLVGFKLLGRDGWTALPVLAMVLLASVILHRFIEVPARAYLRSMANRTAQSQRA